jgi:transposase-like protein
LERKYGKPWDQLLTERINRGDSVNKICRDLGISTDTFYRWMEELKENKQPIVVYGKPQGKLQLQKEQQADLACLIALLVEALDARISQRLEALQSPRKRRITRILTDEEGKKLVEETIVETEP